MFRNVRHPVLHLVACGAGPAGDLEPFVKTCQDQGWDVWLVATPAAAAFVDRATMADLTGHPVHIDWPAPDEAQPPPPAGAVAVAPATFNTINKLAYGLSDSYALGLVHEAIALGLPIVTVPAPGEALARHPAFAESVGRLRTWGVSVLFRPPYDQRGPTEEGQPSAQLPWHAAEELLGEWIRFARVPVGEPAG
ncbi:MAG TPA: flavoprotein [Micromonosporaceae bacterium]|nr:flavoprotein [Micromonosporaceae bacterium]